MQHHRHHQHGGLTRFIEMSLDTLGEPESERPAVEKVQGALHQCMEPIEQQEAAVFDVLADGVSAGAVDAARVDEAISRFDAAAEPLPSCVAGPLDELHQVLSPLERQELGDKVIAHGMVWYAVNSAGAKRSEQTGRLAELEQEVSLTPDQIDRLSPAVTAALERAPNPNLEQLRGALQGFSKAFAAETFNARALDTRSTARLAADTARRTALFYQTVAPELTPEQRRVVAAQLREHAVHHRPGGQS
jgi:hypothetical protein